MDRKIVLSYGGGRQSVALCVLVKRGLLPRPDAIIAADTSREAQSTWEYLDAYVRPLLAPLGLAVEIASHDLATVDLWGHNGDLLLPCFTATGKLPAFCSGEWKERVIQRWLTERDMRPVMCWIGYSTDERQRANRPDTEGWYKRAYPLLDLMLTRADCEEIIRSEGLPIPHKSACYMCPHRHNEEWRLIRDQYLDQWQAAQEIDREIREWDSQVFLHQSRVPLAQANIDEPDRENARQCGLGYCFI